MLVEETGRLAENIVHFARLLRGAGLPVGPGHAIDAVRAVEVAGVRSREDFRAPADPPLKNKLILGKGLRRIRGNAG